MYADTPPLRLPQSVPQAVMIGAQSGLFYWKKQHKRSYELVCSVCLACCSVRCPFAPAPTPAAFCTDTCCLRQVTLMGLWLVPVVISVYMVWWKFVLVSLFVLYTADRLQIDVFACKCNQLQITGYTTYALSMQFINNPCVIVRILPT